MYLYTYKCINSNVAKSSRVCIVVYLYNIVLKFDQCRCCMAVNKMQYSKKHTHCLTFHMLKTYIYKQVNNISIDVKKLFPNKSCLVWRIRGQLRNLRVVSLKPCGAKNFSFCNFCLIAFIAARLSLWK